MCNNATSFSIKTILIETENILFRNSFLTIENYLKCFAWKRDCPISLELQHCAEGVQIRSFSGPYFPLFSPNTGKYGPENSVFRHFLRSANVTKLTKDILESSRKVLQVTFK